MARPKKDPSLLMDVDLRIPVTTEQKQMIYDAASADQSDVAAWIRPILLKAAQARLGKKRGAKAK
jgi:uncharacterized protein (DUF1778 family)